MTGADSWAAEHPSYQGSLPIFNQQRGGRRKLVKISESNGYVNKYWRKYKWRCPIEVSVFGSLEDQCMTYYLKFRSLKKHFKLKSLCVNFCKCILKLVADSWGVLAWTYRPFSASRPKSAEFTGISLGNNSHVACKSQLPYLRRTYHCFQKSVNVLSSLTQNIGSFVSYQGYFGANLTLAWSYYIFPIFGAIWHGPTHTAHTQWPSPGRAERRFKNKAKNWKKARQWQYCCIHLLVIHSATARSCIIWTAQVRNIGHQY